MRPPLTAIVWTSLALAVLLPGCGRDDAGEGDTAQAPEAARSQVRAPIVTVSADQAGPVNGKYHRAFLQCNFMEELVKCPL